jgi:Cutinase
MRGSIVALTAALATTSMLQVPSSVRIGQRVSVYASGRVAGAVRDGDAVLLEIQPTVNRGGNGFGAAPKFRAVVVGNRVRVEFRWPSHDEACSGAAHCVRTPWQIGSRVDINVCAENRMFVVDGCARGTTVVLPSACPGVDFIGARGSGEPFGGFDGMGPAVDQMSRVLRTGLAKSGLDMQTVGVHYSADSADELRPSRSERALLDVAPAAALAVYAYHNLRPFLHSIDTGIADTISLANDEVAKCPATELVLAGYSQGAMVIHQAELQLRSRPRTFQRIAGTLLLADGDRVSYTRAHEFGSSLARAEGIRTYIYRSIPLLRITDLFLHSVRDVALPASTANICNAGDLVCDFNDYGLRHASQAIKIHTSYAVKTSHGMRYAPVLAQAATWLARKILLHR